MACLSKCRAVLSWGSWVFFSAYVRPALQVTATTAAPTTAAFETPTSKGELTPSPAKSSATPRTPRTEPMPLHIPTRGVGSKSAAAGADSSGSQGSSGELGPNRRVRWGEATRLASRSDQIVSKCPSLAQPRESIPPGKNAAGCTSSMFRSAFPDVLVASSVKA